MWYTIKEFEQKSKKSLITVVLKQTKSLKISKTKLPFTEMQQAQITVPQT